MKAGQALSIADLRAAAHRRLPKVVFDYVEGGAEDQVTLRANLEAFQALRFAPRTLVDVSHRTQAVSLFGRQYASPIGIAPLGAAGLCRHQAEIALACAARAAQVPFVLSTHSCEPLERIVAHAGAGFWFQLYMPNDRGAAQEILQRAHHAGCEALVLTTDVPVGGNREYNTRNGFSMPPRLGLRTMLDGLLHPRWLVGDYLRGSWRGIPRWSERRDTQCWDDLAWLRRMWPRRLLVKGILGVEDAKLAVQHGVDGIVVSNHGGRQLDGAPASLEVLPRIAAAVGDEVAVLFDGGVRRGSDVVKALALGARMVFVGRAALYGAAAGGEAGARRALQILSGEVDRVLALLGVNSIEELGPERLLGAEVRRASAASGFGYYRPLWRKAGSSSSSASPSPG